MSLRIHKAKRQDEGSCNFCTAKHNVIYVIKSDDPDRRLVVRFCRKCLSQLDKAKYL